MDHNSFKGLTELKLKVLLPEFICNNSGDFPYFEKVHKTSTWRIRFAIQSGFNRYKFGGIGPEIRFETVENILSPFYIKYKLPNEGRLTSTIKGLAFNVGINAITFDNFPWIETENDFNITIPRITKNISSIVLPFFESYQTLEKANEYIESLSVNELSKFISGPVPLKRLVIKRLCNNSDWIDYGKNLLEFFKEKAITTPQHYKNLDLVTQELMEKLINL